MQSNGRPWLPQHIRVPNANGQLPPTAIPNTILLNQYPGVLLPQVQAIPQYPNMPFVAQNGGFAIPTMNPLYTLQQSSIRPIVHHIPTQPLGQFIMTPNVRLVKNPQLFNINRAPVPIQQTIPQQLIPNKLQQSIVPEAICALSLPTSIHPVVPVIQPTAITTKTPPVPNSASQQQKVAPPQPPPPPKQLFPIKVEPEIKVSQKQQKSILIEDLLRKPGRDRRPAKMVFILRGPPGGGKSYIANLIKNEEEKNNGQKPKILSIDNYFMSEQEEQNCSSKVKQIVMKYEYDKAMDEAYQKSLVKSFKKTIDDDLFEFIIVDMVNERLHHIEEMSSYAQLKGFQVFIIETITDVIKCTNRNIHNRTFKEIHDIIQNWETVPVSYTKIDVSSLLQEADIKNIETSNVDKTIGKDEEKSKEKETKIDEIIIPIKSKWEKTDKIETETHKKSLKHALDEEESSSSENVNTTITLKDYLKLDQRNEAKKVKWVDVNKDDDECEYEYDEIRKKNLGFVVGQAKFNN